MKISLLPRLVLLAPLAFATTLPAISPAALRERLAGGESLTIVDVRSTVFFQRAHIPGAINIPAAIVEEKTLPRLGQVVVYDDGLADTNAAFAATALSRKPGIAAEVLQGGFAAWESATTESTRESGLARDETPQISYDKLKATAPDDVVLVDLRQPSAGSVVKSDTKSPPVPWSDLDSEFPGASVTTSPFRVPAVTKSGKAQREPLLVLIDNNDGAAQRMARTLKANGVRRFVVLTGGEEIIARKGQRGLQRAGGGSIEVQKPDFRPSRTP